ncbi:hypothetical protein HELRODRAFT_178890 [Helobdella robusta]|uniref:SMP-30/Gluconolactonase/LRE-like region domain-containing protein n=1 Tax=Helobdella robusta TaxID=6412 RepID=T1FDV1_HELRO|nr:hypothetical protein HELRODRAFT_178890 [Helobdella robusta]ESN95971.1 hypothetical protein HELRODRAFT_178890 [Helobdella robusta]
MSGSMKKKRTIHATEFWSLESSRKSHNNNNSNNNNNNSNNNNKNNNNSLIQVPSDVKFFRDTNFLVADSVGHGVFLLSPVDDGETFARVPCGEEDSDDRDCLRVDDEDTKNREDIRYARDNTFTEKKNNLNRIPDNNSSNDKLSGKIDGYFYKKLFHEKIWPNCLVVLLDNKVRLTDRKTKSIKTFDIETEKLVSEWECPEDENSQIPVQINGIAYSPNHNQTIITDTTHHCIRIFDDKGQQIKTFCSRGDLLHHLRLPFYVTMDTKDHILVSDNMNYCVKIFDMEGNFINRIGSGNLFGNRQFQSPYGLSVGEGNNDIYVADHDSNKDGQFISYATAGSACESPCAVDVNEDGGLMVVTLSSPSISDVKLFRIE